MVKKESLDYGIVNMSFYSFENNNAKGFNKKFRLARFNILGWIIEIFKKDDMKLSSKGLRLIQKFEGLSLKAYKCSAGVWTIGYGHTKDVQEGMIISETEARRLLINDIKRFERYVNQRLKDNKLNQNQFDALVSFAFNLGSIKSGFYQALKDNDYRKASKILPLYHKAGGEKLLGLYRRRFAEWCLFWLDIEPDYEQINKMSFLDIQEQIKRGY